MKEMFSYGPRPHNPSVGDTAVVWRSDEELWVGWIGKYNNLSPAGLYKGDKYAFRVKSLKEKPNE